MIGICRSSRITQGRRCRIRASASLPSAASTALYPEVSSRRAMSGRIRASSSTIRTRGIEEAGSGRGCQSERRRDNAVAERPRDRSTVRRGNIAAMSQIHRQVPIRTVLCAAATIVSSLVLPSAQSAPDWVARSNLHTRVLLEAQAKLAPEGAAQIGVSGVDDQITDFSPGYTQRIRENVTKARQELQRRLAAEKDPLVRQDLEILLAAI